MFLQFYDFEIIIIDGDIAGIILIKIRSSPTDEVSQVIGDG